MDADKPVPVVNISPVRFIGGPKIHIRIVSIEGSWDIERLVAVITTVVVPVEGGFDDIGMKSIRVVIRIEWDGEAS